MRYELSRTFPVPRHTGYEYLTDLKTWHEWSPIRIPKADKAKLRKVDDVIAYRYRPMGLPIRGKMRLAELLDGELYHLVFEQPAYPPVHLMLEFDNAGAHAFTLKAVVEINDPHWWDKTYQRISMIPMVMKRDIRESFEVLHRHFIPQEEVKQAS